MICFFSKVLDEVHERHIHTDFLLGAVKCLVQVRDDLKVQLKKLKYFFVNNSTFKSGVAAVVALWLRARLQRLRSQVWFLGWTFFSLNIHFPLSSLSSYINLRRRAFLLSTLSSPSLSLSFTFLRSLRVSHLNSSFQLFLLLNSYASSAKSKLVFLSLFTFLLLLELSYQYKTVERKK